MKVHLKKFLDKITVVFDLDETLIHCNDSIKTEHHVTIPITFPDGKTVEAGINIRPGAKEILRDLSSKFELMIFTAGH